MHRGGTSMTDKLRTSGAVLAGAIAAAVALPSLAWALGLGQIHSDTRIGQAFEARIPILAASNADLQGLDVGLASTADYKQAGVTEPDFLFDLKFAVKQGPKGPYVLVTSDKPVRLPFLNLMVHASWSSDEVTRQYTVLLNPPTFAAGKHQRRQQSVSAPSPATRTATAQPAHRQPAAQPRPQQILGPGIAARSGLQRCARRQPIETSTTGGVDGRLVDAPQILRWRAE